MDASDARRGRFEKRSLRVLIVGLLGLLVAGVAFVPSVAHASGVAPTAADDSYTTAAGTALNVPAPGVLGNDTDPELDPLTASIASGASHGTANLAADGSFSYTPTAGYSGPDSFTYTASDGTGTSNTATVSITVTAPPPPPNTPPVASDNAVTTAEDTAKSIALGATDADGDPLTYSVVTGVSHGTLNCSSGGACTYTPASNYNGADSFTFVANDGTANSNTATVSITVTPVNDAPIASDQTVTLTEDTPVTFDLGATDPEGDTLSFGVDTTPAKGTLSCASATGHCTYTPAHNDDTTQSFTFHASDGTLLSNTATVTLSIIGVNDPPSAAAEAFMTPFNVALQAPAPGVLASAHDPENDPMTAAVAAGPAHGTLTLAANGSFTYDPDPNFKGVDAFTYVATDSHGAKSAAATVTISVEIQSGTGPVNFVGTAAAEERGFVSSLARGLHIDLRDGADTYDLFLGALRGIVQVDDSGTHGADRLATFGTNGGDNILVDDTHVGSGSERITYNHIESLVVNGQGGNDTITLGPGAFGGVNEIIADGGSGDDTLVVDAGNRPASVKNGRVLVEGWPAITYRGFERLDINSTATPRTVSSDGYWLFASDGGVFTFGDAKFYGSTGGLKLHSPIIQMISTPSGRGYWLLASDGGVFSFGDAKFYGSTGGLHLRAPIIQMVATQTGRGYWLLASDGGVFTFGDARFYGSAGKLRLRAPVVQMVQTIDGRGYWLRGSDGGIFSFGDAKFFGSTGGLRLTAPIIQMVPSPTGDGYWLLASNGAVFGFGAAGFHGSTATLTISSPTVQLVPTPTGKGYWLLHADGSVFGFGDAGYYGSMLGKRINAPMVQMIATPSGHGYWLLASDGGIFTFGDARFHGSTGGLKLKKPILRMIVRGL